MLIRGARLSPPPAAGLRRAAGCSLIIWKTNCAVHDDRKKSFIAPLDELSNAITRAEQELKALQSRQLDQTAEMWNRYKPG